MEHVVFYPAVDGSPAFQRCTGLESAVSLVEHLRNVESVSDVAVFALTEVPLAFRPYYRVELPAALPPEQPGDRAPAADPGLPAAVAVAVAEPTGTETRTEDLAAMGVEDVVPAARVEAAPVPAAAGLGPVDGARGLGFFAS